MLKCENLVKVYSGCRAVDGLNLELDAGRIYALLGPNGSGKSTFMKMVVGLIKPTEGKSILTGKKSQTRQELELHTCQQKIILQLYEN